MPLLDLDRVLGEDAEHLAVLLVPDRLRQVLDEVAAARDVEELEAAADRERRQVALERRLEEAQLAGVAVRLRRVGLRMPLSAVVSRVDVAAAGEDDPVEHVERLVDAVLARGHDSARPPARSTAVT